MAIEISSKTKIKSPVWSVILGALCLILLLASISSYFYLNSLTKKIRQKIQEKENALKSTPSEMALENNLILTRNKIDKFADLLSKHHDSASVLTFLENTCLPNVQFLNFNFDDGKNTVSISGKANSFITLEQQIDVLKKESLVKNIEVSDILMSEEGGANFDFLIILDPKIFNPTK